MELTEVLRGGRQCDEDGVEIIMSRQACCEAADVIENLAALVNRLCRQINKVAPHNDVAIKASAYMYQNNLIGTSLRKDDEGLAKLVDMVTGQKVDADETANVEVSGPEAALSPEGRARLPGSAARESEKG